MLHPITNITFSSLLCVEMWPKLRLIEALCARSRSVLCSAQNVEMKDEAPQEANKMWPKPKVTWRRKQKECKILDPSVFMEQNYHMNPQLPPVPIVHEKEINFYSFNFWSEQAYIILTLWLLFSSI